MKINKITIQNINSLKGSFTIDFREFEEDGLFAITGATGSGKTTILDAITLALFGKTPRLKNSTEEIMSKHTGECLSECEFEIKEEIYISSFSQKRAYSKPDGRIQPAKMKLFKENGEIIESGISNVTKKVEEITGLDFSRFTRSILLAQGGFDAFLKANENEKAELLEKMTSTKIYAEISARVFEKTKEAENRYKAAKEKMEAVETLKSEEIENYQNSLKEIEKQLNSLKSYKKEIEKKYQSLKRVNELQNSLEEKEKEKKEVLKREDSLKERFSLLKRAILAKEIKHIYEKYEEKKTSIKTLEKNIQTLEKEIKQTEKRLNSYLLLAQKELLKNREKKREYQQTLKDEKEKLNKSQKEYEKEDLTSLLEEKEEISKKGYELKSFKEKLQRMDFLTKELKEAEKKIAFLKEGKEKVLKDIKEKEEKIKLLQDIVIKTEKQKELESKIINYEKERTKLKEGEPCPLCGSLTHPFVNTSLPKLSETEKELENRKKELEKEQKVFYELKIRAEKLKSDEENIKRSLNAIQKEIKEIENINIPFKTPEEIEERLKLLRIEYKKAEEKIRALKKIEKLINETKEKISFYEKSLTAIDFQIEKFENILKNIDFKVSLEDENFEEEIKKTKDLLNEIIRFDKELDSKRELLVQNIKREKIEKENKKSLEREFLNSLKSKGFENEEEFKKALLKDEEIEKIQNQKKEIEERLIEINSSIKHFKKELENLKEGEKESLKEITKLLEEKEKEIEELQKESIQIKTTLENNENNLKKREKLENEYKELFEKYKLHSQLNALIGSSKGEKFRRFAQTLTFELLTKLANIHLNRLTDRYLLEKDPNQGLSFLVIDTYQANIKRGINTLSGGESFIVSLSLALGLCDLLSRKVKIKTLFLDEGFGTLDAQTLESVLSALNSIKSSGKTIGIISHVEALKERISREIKVIKLSGGVSKIEII